MSDVTRYIEKRKQEDVEFAFNFEGDYTHFKIEVLLRQAREAAGLTQNEVAQRLQTQKSVIS